MYHSILVPLDGSTFGEQALPLAVTLARRSGAVLRLAHAHSPELVSSIVGLAAVDESLDGPSRESERAYLDGLAQRLATTWDLDVATELLEGSPVAALREHATDTSASLIVMSTHGRGPMSRVWLGSVADALVRQVPMPVLAIRPHLEALDVLDMSHERIIRHVLVPLDGSTLAEDALAQAVELGRLMAAEYTLLQAVDPIVMDLAPSARLSGLDEHLVAELQAAAQEYLAGVARRLRAKSLRVSTAAVVAPASSAILEYARHHAIDLIAMATHGRVGVSRVVLGSVADKVVRGAFVPVLLHRPRA
jgi:nucleotide-binding universal stress UspA family protein